MFVFRVSRIAFTVALMLCTFSLCKVSGQLCERLSYLPARLHWLNGKLTCEQAKAHLSIYEAGASVKTGLEKLKGRGKPRLTGPPPSAANVQYGPHERNVLDFWQVQSEAPTPLVVFFHAGAFKTGDKSQFIYTQLFLETGIACASANYRLRPNTALLDILHDGGRVVQFLRHNAAYYNIDPKRIAVIGVSAGAGMSLWLAVHDDLAEPMSEDPVLRQSSRVPCMSGWSPQCSYDPKRWHNLVHPLEPDSDKWQAEAEELALRNMSPEDRGSAAWKAVLAEVDMYGMLDNSDPPMLLFSEAPDVDPGMKGFNSNHHPRHCKVIKEKADEVGVVCQTFFKKCEPIIPKGKDYFQLVLEFICEYLKPDTAHSGSDFIAAPAFADINLSPRKWGAKIAPMKTKVESSGLPRVSRGKDGRIVIETDCLGAEVWPSGYVSGVKANTLVDRKTGARDNSFGLDIVDFLMGPGAEGGIAYEFGNKIHGNIAKHYIELPQICTGARHINSEFVTGPDFVAVRQWWKWTEAAPGYTPGSLWEQTLVFPMGRRYFISCDCVQSANTVDELFLRIDMPGHIKHHRGDTFEQIYLSYEGYIAACDFFEDFAPDSRHFYQRGTHPLPQRMIRAHKIRGERMPWLAGMTLEPNIVSEAWCHQRGYVCFIQEVGRLPVKPGDRFAASYIVGFFDSVEQMQVEYDRYRGFTSLAATKDYWLLSEGVIVREQLNRFRIVPQGRWPTPKQWRVLAHGRGKAVVNGRQIKINGEHILEVPQSK